jgi:hypothetical protein
MQQNQLGFCLLALAASAPRQLMASCDKKASTQKLQDLERKTFLTVCMKGK